MRSASTAITLLTLFCGPSLIGASMNTADDAHDQWTRVINKLRDPDEKVRLAAAEALNDVAFATRAAKRSAEQERAFKDQLETLAKVIRDKKEHPRVRGRVVHALAVGELGSMAQLAVTSVVDVLRDEAEDDYLRCEAAMSFHR